MTQRRKLLNPTLLTIFCGLLLSVTAFSIDIMLPAFDNMQSDLGTPIERVQLAVPLFAIGYALSQLVFGPASDRFGRRIVLIAGLVTFFAGAIIAATAPTIEVVLAGRVLQGFGGGAGQVIGRAILRDCNAGQKLARAMALAMSIFSFGPIFAPLLGYGLTAAGDWRLIFTAMIAFSVLLLAAAVFWLQETNSAPDRNALKPAVILQSLGAIVKNWQSRTFLLIAIAAYCALLSFVTNAPRIYASSFGISGLPFAALFASTGFGIMLGQLANRKLLAHRSILSIMRFAAFMLLLVSSMIAGAAWLDILSAFSFTVLMFLFNTSFLVVISNAASLIIHPHQTIAGMASAVLGFATLMGSSIYVTLTLPIFDGKIELWAFGMIITTAITFVSLWLIKAERISFAG